jgi:hypothetical protein
MSLPYEQVMAQERVWKAFCEGDIPRKMWPKHFMGPAELKMLFDKCEEYRIRSEVYRELLPSMSEDELDDAVNRRMEESANTLHAKINFNNWSKL